MPAAKKTAAKPGKKPQDRKPKAPKKPAAPVGRKAVLLVDGVRHHLIEANMTPLDVLALRKATGYSLMQVFEIMQVAPDLDVIAIVLWLSRRTNGEPELTFTEVATSFSYESDFEVVADEGDLQPPEV